MSVLLGKVGLSFTLGRFTLRRLTVKHGLNLHGDFFVWLIDFLNLVTVFFLFLMYFMCWWGKFPTACWHMKAYLGSHLDPILGCSCHFIYRRVFVLRVSVCMHECVHGVMCAQILILSLHPLDAAWFFVWHFNLKFRKVKFSSLVKAPASVK